MRFSATLFDTPYDDPKEFAAYLKANPLGVKPYSPPSKPKVFVKPRVVLTALEREWLGATVRRSDGLEGQVWSLAHSKPGKPAALWLVAAGVAHRADICEVTLVQSRVDQLALDL